MSFQKINKELQQLLKFIYLEKEEELNSYHAAIQNHSFKEQRNLGICWYPVNIQKTSYDSGERLLVRISRIPEHEQGHNFQSGKSVRLFRNTNNEISKDESVNAIVNNVKNNEMLITLNSEELPEWVQHGYIGLQLLFDENVYKEMKLAVNYLLETEEENTIRLKNTLLGARKAEFIEQAQIESSYLNRNQNKALNKALSAQDLAIIHGPPGTGKTTTLVEAIAETLKKENQVLVSAQSNAAVDLVVEKLSSKGINVVRIGHPARVNQEILQSTLDAQYARHETYKELRAVRRKAQEYRKLAAKYKRNFGATEREQRRLLYSEAKKLRKEAEQLSFYIRSDILSKAQVIACTMIGAANSAIKGLKFDTVFIDEASQAVEPATWIPIIKAKRVIFAGDHHQLPPTIKSYKAAKEGFEITLFEKSIKRNSADIMLDTQYRMNELIMQFSSAQFYHDKLVADISVAQHKIFEDDYVFEFIDTAGTGYFEQINNQTLSTFNTEEANLLVKHLITYIEQIEEHDALRELRNIGIISPYRAQTKLLKKLIFGNSSISTTIQNFIDINTVDSFQGQERDVVYISMVRSNEKNKIGFLADIRRMNVALTRARKKLVVIGDSATIAKHPFYSAFLDYVEKKAHYRSAFEFI